MRILLILALLGSGAFLLFTDSGQTKIDGLMDVIYGDPNEHPRYIEGRFKASVGSRELEMVFVGTLKQHDSCDLRSGLMSAITTAHCKECEEIKFTCDIEPRPVYLNMLDGKPARTAYLHMHNKHIPYRRAALLVWGATVDEFKQVCPTLLRNFEQANDFVVGECL